MLVSTARLESVLQTAVDGIVVIDQKGTILVYNGACEKMFGYTREEVVGQNVAMLMPKSHAIQHDEYIRRYQQTGEKRIIGIGREVEGQHKDGTNFPIELSVGEADTSDGQQFIGIIRDLRSKREIENRLRELQSNLVVMTRVNALDEMGAAIAHEINQPLTALMLYIQTAARRVKSQDDHDEQLLKIMEKAVDEAGRASQIIQRMRGFVEKQEPKRTGVCLQKLINDCMELVHVSHRDDGVKVVNAFADAQYKLAVDAVQIQQILINLIRNACQAARSSEAPTVTISAVLEPENVLVKVQDTGPGLPDAARENLFKAFSGTKQRGLGVGLAISRSIAQNHGGDLYAEPYQEGEGATFVLRIPVKTTADNAKEPEDA
ncbi:two-component system sensor histidine kinase NtrB [Polycladidibacter hongkongensis]|uniref:two-component system sensor histidine kinase NtrB n=1 Tax=Polycladidibacter hongkongensis TaxID=1647556 RepID=UPI000A3FB8C3|nr:PAS domain S-box protein [Pseudovibrio hongkongensis]